MRALSVQQPYASLIVCGAKRLETRSRQTSYRGWLAIHASKACSVNNQLLCWQKPFSAALQSAGFLWPALPDSARAALHVRHEIDLPLGAIVGFAELTKVYCTEMLTDPPPPSHWYHHADTLSADERAFGDWGLGRWAWRLDKPHMLKEPLPARGALGLWNWEPPAEVAAWLRELEVQP